MARRRVNTTKYEIIQKSTELFLELGYSATTPKMICDALDISTGNLTYYFHTKENLLEVLVELLCEFQGEVLKNRVQEEGKTSLLAACLEMAVIATIADDDPVAKDLFQAFYLSPLCLDYIRRNDAERAMYIYGEYCPDWTKEQYIEAEILVSGIEYAVLTTDQNLLPIEDRIMVALNNMMMIFNVPENIRKQKIKKILDMDYHAIAKSVMLDFKKFVFESNDHVFEKLLEKSK